MPSTVHQAREILGSRLRELRRDAGMTGRDLASLAGWHSSKVSRIEYGKQNPSERDIRAWCVHTHAEDQVPDLIASLRGIEALWVEWRKQLALGTRGRQKVSIALAEQTKMFRAYDPTVIWHAPNRAYAREIMSLGVKFHQVRDDLDRGVAGPHGTPRFLYQVTGASMSCWGNRHFTPTSAGGT